MKIRKGAGSILLISDTIKKKSKKKKKLGAFIRFLYFFFSQYLGRWYEYANYFAIFQLFGKCVTATYSNTVIDGKPAIKVVNDAINEK